MGKKSMKLSGLFLLVLLMIGLSGGKTYADGSEVEVKSFSELKTALLNKEVVKITIVAPIEFTESIVGVPNRNVEITALETKSQKLDMKTFKINGQQAEKNTTLTVSNLDIVGDKATSVFFESGSEDKDRSGWNLVAENISYEGLRFADVRDGKLTFTSKNTVKTTLENAIVQNLEFTKGTSIVDYTGESGINNELVESDKDVSTFWFNSNKGLGAIVATASTINIRNNHRAGVTKEVPAFYDKLNRIDINGGNLKIQSAGLAFGTMSNDRSLKKVEMNQSGGFITIDTKEKENNLSVRFEIPTEINVSGYFNILGNNSDHEGIVKSDNLIINADKRAKIKVENYTIAGIAFSGGYVLNYDGGTVGILVYGTKKDVVEVAGPSKLSVIPRSGTGVVKVSWYPSRLVVDEVRESFDPDIVNIDTRLEEYRMIYFGDGRTI